MRTSAQFIRPSSIAAAAAALIAAAAPLSGTESSGSTTGEAIAEPIGPRANWDEIREILRRIDEFASDAWVAIDGDAGPLQEPALSRVAADLDAIEHLIAQVLDPGIDPNLTPAGAGAVDPAFDPQTLPAYARDVLDLAAGAVAWIESPVPDHDAIGTDLKTILYLIDRPGPHNFRTAAGLGGGRAVSPS